MDEKMKFLYEKSQATIWIILAVILVASILLFFALTREITLVKPPAEDVSFDIDSFLSACAGEYVNEVVDIMLLQGGFVNPENTVFFNNTNIEYLCENIGFYEPCINQHPMLLNEMKWEIENYIKPRISTCYEDMENEFERRGADVRLEYGQPYVKVNFGPDRVYVYMKKGVTIKKRNETRSYDEHNIEIVNPVYNLASIAVEIASQEARFCYFEFVGYNILYPRYKVIKYVMSKPNKIYTIKDKNSGKEMNTAIRSCAIPAGG